MSSSSSSSSSGPTQPTLQATIRSISLGITQFGLPIACGCWDGVSVALPYILSTNRWEGSATICGGKSVTLTYIPLPGPAWQLRFRTDACGGLVDTILADMGGSSKYCSRFLTNLTGNCCQPFSYDFSVEIFVTNPSGPCPTPPPVVPMPECREGDPCGCAPVASGASLAPIRYATGEVVLEATDVLGDGYGVPWGHTRSFSSRLSRDVNMGNGYNWQIREWPYLNLQSTAAAVIVMGRAQQVLWFDKVGNNYVPRFDVRHTLQLDSAAAIYRLTALDGTVTEFSSVTGRLLRQTSPGGAKLEVTALAANGWNIAEVQRSITAGGTTTTESFVYGYDNPAAAGARLTSVMLRRKIDAGEWNNVTRAVYTYYQQGDLHGGIDDLKTVTTQTWQDSAWVDNGTTLYRYWLAIGQPGTSSSSSSSSSGAGGDTFVMAPHLLKYVVNPASYERLKADRNVTNPLTASDTIVSLYADVYYEYDTQRRVTKEAVQGASRTFLFTYAQSSFSDGTNRWKFKTTETLPDGSQNILFANYAGQTMLKVFQSGGSQWYEFFKYSTDAKILLHANSSAITGYDETKPDLLNEVAGNYQYVKDNDGLIRTYAYHASSGWVTAEKIQKGELGAPLKLREYEHVACSVGTSPPSYFLSKETVYPSDTDQTKTLVTTYAYTFYAGTCAVQQTTTTLPVVPTSQNGSGVAATRKEFFDQYGNLTWQMDERGFITRMKYDVVSGAVTQRIDDVDTAQVTDEPPGWVTPTGGGLHLITDLESDSQGRTTQVLAPVHAIDLSGVAGAGGSATSIRRASWIVFKESSTGRENWTGQGYQTVSDGSFTLINPVSLTKMDVGGRVSDQIQATRASTSGKLQPTDSFPQSSNVRWTTTQYTDCCFAASQRVYHTIPASGSGSEGTNYDETDFGYSVMKRQNRVVTPGGTIAFTVFDVRGQVLTTYVGTNDTGATENDPTGGGAAGNNMVLVTTNEYDSGVAGGDGNMTKQTQHVDASSTRVTTFLFDWRDRHTDTDGEIDFYEQRLYDNLDRVTLTDRRNTTSSGNLIARSETKYDDRGRVYQSIRYAVNVSTGAVGNALTDNTWYDAAENVIKSLPARASVFTKPTYDGLGRRLKTYRGYDLTESSYADISMLVGDTIVEQQEATYDAASNVIQSVSRQRYHNATGTGELNGPAGPQPKARVTYQASYPDPLGRIIATADYGTNGGSALSRPATVPARSDSVLVTSTAFNSAGQVAGTTNPGGISTCLEYDAAGRQTKVIMNCVTSGSSSSSSSSGGCPPSDDVIVTVLTAYTADGNVWKITAVNAATGNQVTEYVYGTTLSDSDVATSTLKRAEVYPDSVDASDRIEFKYNRLSQTKEIKDQAGTVHTLEFDKLGRPTQGRVTTLGTGVDGSIRRIASTFEVRGMRDKLTSYDNATVGSGGVVNEVQFSYNDFSQLTADYQSHSGAVNTSTTPKVQYAYASGSANTIRPTSLTYPNGRVITLDYSTTGSMPDALSRIDAIKDGSTALAQYSYLGGRTFAITDYTQPDIKWTLADLTGTNDPDTGDIYSGFDRFSRIKDNRWYNYGTSTDTDRIKYGYDRNGNRTYRENTVAIAAGAKFDEKYLYDLIDRLKHLDRGHLTALKDAITNKTFAQCWQLDATGNWKNFRQDDDGNGTWDLNQTRTDNTVNEITDITETAGPSWVTPAYNRAGNMTTIPKPSDPTQSYTATYDAAKRRTVQKSYTAGILAETRHLYYTQPSQWQVLEERTGTSPDTTTAERQSVWGLRYIDDLVLRDRDTDGNGSLDERLYALQDANWNVTAITNTSGTVQERYAYTAYGVPVFLDASFGSRTSSSFQSETLYAGYRWNANASMFHVRNRVYQPRIGSWLSRDLMPVSRGNTHLYAYAESQPLIAVDPQGLFSSFAVPFFPPLDLPTFTPSDIASLLSNVVAAVNSVRLTCACALAVSGLPALIDSLILPDPRGLPNWSWQHCTSNCLMVATCGCDWQAVSCATLLSFLKEELDLVGCYVLDGGPSTSERCRSAFQQSDFRDNKAGRRFGRECCPPTWPFGRPRRACDPHTCCDKKCRAQAPLGAEEGPGKPRPYGPFADPGNPPADPSEAGPWPTWVDLLPL